MTAGLLSAIAGSAARFPDRVAHRSPDAAVTYRELWERAGRLAAWVERQPTGPVLVYGHKEPALPIAFLACGRAGRPYVPCDTVLPPARVRRIAELSRAAAVVTAGPLPPEVAGLGLPLLEAGPAAEHIPEAAPPPAPADDEGLLAYIIFTSGSTGDPKGVPIAWRAVGHFVEWLVGQQRCRAGDEVVLNQAPFSFDLSVMDLYLALSTGGTLHSVTRDMVEDPRRLFSALAAADLTVWVSTPSFARFCLAAPTFRQALLPRLRRFLFCGETLPPAVAQQLQARFPRAEVWNTYGPTETTVAVTSVHITPDLAASPALPVGRPAPGMEVWVAGEDLAAVPEGESGEIVIAGPQVSPGYVAADPAARLRFVPLPGGGLAYRTGDAGHLAGGLLYCDGRLDRQVKVHGFRLELDEIEAHLRRLPGVADAAVVPVARGGAVQYLVGFVVERDPAPEGMDFARAQALRDALGQTLPPYALPRRLQLVPSLPLTANGKIDRQTLAALASS